LTLSCKYYILCTATNIALQQISLYITFNDNRGQYNDNRYNEII